MRSLECFRKSVKRFSEKKHDQNDEIEHFRVSPKHGNALEQYTRRNGAGIAGSLALHLLLALMVLGWMARHLNPLPSVPSYFPVDLIRLGLTNERPAGPVGPPQVSAPTLPQQEAASPTDAAIGPNGRKPVEDSLDAKLKALARLKQPNPKLVLDNNAGTAEETTGGGTGGLLYSLRDYLRAQILRRWNLNLSRLAGRHLTIRLAITLKQTGAITAAEIVGPLPAGDLVFQDVALSARNAALLASPIALPPGDYPKEMHVTVSLDTRETRR